MVTQFDCSELFPHYDFADAVVINDSVRIRLFSEETHIHLDMDINKISNFLENCRKQQDPRIYRLA